MNNVNINLKALNFPDKPGVYLMKDRQNKIIYIGKAKNLRKRINSYFTGSPSPKTNFLVKNIKNIETIITKTEQEALLLENNLIKKWKPKYNIDLKDGKTYPVIRITNEEYPRIFRTRRIIFDGSVYYGPFPSAHQIDTYLKLIDRMFPLRKCRGSLKKKRAHPCLNYYIGRCFSPCTGRISKDEYREMVGKIKSLLSGKASELIRDTRERMLKASRSLNFEEAAVFRDNLSSIKFIMDQQHIIDFSKLSGDYIGYCSSEHIFTFVILQMRDGKLIGREIFNSESYAETEETFLHFIFQYYTEAQNIPSIVYIPELTDSRQATILSKQLKSSLSGKKLRFIIPKRGKHLQTLKMALENADEYLTSRLSMYNRTEDLEFLKKTLNLPSLPRRIEGFDIAHLSGQYTVASMVSFKNGIPDKDKYRHFKIRSLKGRIDDFEAMREVIARRYTRIINEELDKPDLILVDGGKGQLNAAKQILNSIGLRSVPVAGLAKKNEEIFMPGQSNPIVLEKNSGALRILEQVRDESHRFANSLHSRLRRNSLTSSKLTSIPGIGKIRSKILLEKFKSFDDIGNLSVEEIAEITGFNNLLASTVRDHLLKWHNEKKAE